MDIIGRVWKKNYFSTFLKKKMWFFKTQKRQVGLQICKPKRKSTTPAGFRRVFRSSGPCLTPHKSLLEYFILVVLPPSTSLY